jgi:glucokinase
MNVIAGDIGGTNSRLAIIGRGKILFERHYASRDFGSFQDVLKVFLKDAPEPVPLRACIAAAGIVKDNCIEATNIPWVINGNELKKNFELETVRLINDFEAAAWGITALDKDQLIQIGEGRPVPDGPKAILGAGTGLGQAILAPCTAEGYRVLPTEGGHSDFAPRNEKQILLLKYLLKKFSHVSVERVLSGPGLVRIYDFLLKEQNSEKGIFIEKTEEETDKPAQITHQAIKERNDLCLQTVRLFCSIYGAEAGNLALKCLATGGVYVAGGIALNILPILNEGGFRQAFEEKGRMKKVLKHIPTYIVKSTQLGILGAALVAGK